MDAAEPAQLALDRLPLRISVADIVDRASLVAFGKPLVTNVLRAMLVEAMIDAALPSQWTWCSADYAAWDFQHADKTKLEVKQSAARQSWTVEGAQASRCLWDIAERSGR